MIRGISFFFTVAIVAVLFTGCREDNRNTNAIEAGIPVEVATIRLGEMAQTLGYFGDIEAENEVKVFSKIPDRIERFYVDEGDRVSKGARVAQIFCPTIEQAVRQAEAALLAVKTQEANLRVEYERFETLHRDLTVSQQQFDAVATQYQATQAQAQQAEAALASAKSQLRDATVTAPIAGIIGKRYYEAGDMAAPALPLVSIVQMDRVKMTFEATEEDLARLALGQDATVRVKAFPDRSFTGKIAEISPVLDPQTRMADIEVLLENPAHVLKPGMYAQVEITTGVLSEVMIVPRHAVLETTTLERVHGRDLVARNYYVFVVDSSTARQRKLEVSYLNHEFLAVSAGIRTGEKLVIVGQHNLREGAAVRIAREEVDES